MTKHSLLAAILLVSPPALAGDVTYFGDFTDDFTTEFYFSEDPPEPGAFYLSIYSMVEGIPKFDPALGTLTGIAVSIASEDPILYSASGEIEVSATVEDDPFEGAVTIAGDVGIYYEDSGSSIATVIADFFTVEGGCLGGAGELGCTGGVDIVDEDGVLEGGPESILGLVDLADFVGSGDVDSLFAGMFIETTGAFSLTNATAEAFVDLDVFDGDSGTDDDIVGVTYTFTPVPLPPALWLLGGALLVLAARLRR